MPTTRSSPTRSSGAGVAGAAAAESSAAGAAGPVAAESDAAASGAAVPRAAPARPRARIRRSARSAVTSSAPRGDRRGSGHRPGGSPTGCRGAGNRRGLELELVVRALDAEPGAGRPLAAEDELGERVLEVLLDGALERPGAE